MKAYEETKITSKDLNNRLCEIAKETEAYEKEHPEIRKYFDDILHARDVGAYYERKYWMKVVTILTFITAFFGLTAFIIIYFYIHTL